MTGQETRLADRSARTWDHPLITSKLGQLPDLALQAMDGYGLNDREIGHYFDVSPSSIRRLRRALGGPTVATGIA